MAVDGTTNREAATSLFVVGQSAVWDDPPRSAVDAAG
jgi:hypothetical protein